MDLVWSSYSKSQVYTPQFIVFFPGLRGTQRQERNVFFQVRVWRCSWGLDGEVIHHVTLAQCHMETTHAVREQEKQRSGRDYLYC